MSCTPPPLVRSADKVFATQDANPFVAGEFVWSGWNCLGEPTPYYLARSSYFGIIDLAGFKKDRYHPYQARWRPDLRTAHILPHWTWPDRVGQVTPVHVFSAAIEAELFLNGQSQGLFEKGPVKLSLQVGQGCLSTWRAARSNTKGGKSVGRRHGENSWCGHPVAAYGRPRHHPG